MGEHQRRAGLRTERRTRTLTIGIAWLFGMLIALPAGGLLFGYMEHFGSSNGHGKVTGTATVGECEHHVFDAPYICAATVTWHVRWASDAPGTDVVVRTLRPLSGQQVEVEDRNCRRKWKPSCPIYTVDYPVSSGWRDVPPILLAATLMILGWFVARRIAVAIYGKPEYPPVPQPKPAPAPAPRRRQRTRRK